jgi:hypothetical protein
MRLLRVLAVATGFAAVLSQSSAAQDGREFKDSWFWGLKTGALTYSSLSTTGSAAPMIGGEWLITRTNGGLYVAYDQAFFSTTGGFVDHDPDSTSAFTRNVQLSGMRRLTLAGMLFPKQTRILHPYFGGGLAINQISSATAVGGFSSDARLAMAQDSIQTRKTSASLIVIGGIQVRYNPASVFVQATVSPSSPAFFLSNNNTSLAANVSLEFGVRYNMGSSIDAVK